LIQLQASKTLGKVAIYARNIPYNVNYIVFFVNFVRIFVTFVVKKFHHKGHKVFHEGHKEKISTIGVEQYNSPER
jgi:hypothetical protein